MQGAVGEKALDVATKAHGEMVPHPRITSWHGKGIFVFFWKVAF